MEAHGTVLRAIGESLDQLGFGGIGAIVTVFEVELSGGGTRI
jgi:hypothetical protein